MLLPGLVTTGILFLILISVVLLVGLVAGTIIAHWEIAIIAAIVLYVLRAGLLEMRRGARRRRRSRVISVTVIQPDQPTTQALPKTNLPAKRD